ncbi:unnamed protein product [Schistosoma turkestanicum]|nr:unnamed protein product [Schistosoma turkestanicum]
MPKISIPIENPKRSDSISSNKSHCHQFSVAALTDEVTHSSACSEESTKPQTTILSKSAKHPTGKKRAYRKSEQRDITNIISDKYSHRHNDYDKSFIHCKLNNSTQANQYSIVDNNNNNNKYRNSTINDSLKGVPYFPTTVSTTHNYDRIHDTVSKYASFTNRNVNSMPFTVRNPTDSLPGHHPYLPPRGFSDATTTSCSSQIRPQSSSTATSQCHHHYMPEFIIFTSKFIKTIHGY